MKIKLLFIVSFLFIFAPLVLLAQQQTEKQLNTVSGGKDYDYNYSPKESVKLSDRKVGWNTDEMENNNSNEECFQYYKFQSVQTNIGTDSYAYQDGKTVKFLGTLVNENKYPIANGELYVRISKRDTNDGNDIVDEFFALEDVNLNSNETRNIEFTWDIPKNIARGDYRADYFFVVGKKFNLSGLSFSNEVVGGYSEFTIVSDNGKYVKLDRSSTAINNKKYAHIGNWPVINTGERSVLTQAIQNTFDKKVSVKIMYDLYYWDGLDETNKIEHKVKNLSIDSKGQTEIRYVFPSMKTSVYFLRITTVSENQKSIINVRLTSEQEKSRLNYPAITAFPVKKGDDVTLFSCFHNTSSLNTKGKVILTLTDEKGNKISQAQYDGDITTNMSFVKKEFTAKQVYDKLNLKAEVYDKDGALVDSYETTYDCNKFNTCVNNKTNNKELVPYKYLISIAIAIFLVVVVWLLVEKFIINKRYK